jgi:NAD(P)H-dependent FMN reductase
VKPRLGIVIASVRVNRGGEAVAAWMTERAVAHGGFETEVVDLKQVALPLMAEPNHPRLQQYTRDDTKAWSRTVSALDAFVFVTPEYNHGTPPALSNAIDYLFVEWQYKPVGFVSYGGVSAGLRAVQMTKPMLACLKMVPMVEAVPLPFYAQMVNQESRKFVPGEAKDKAAAAMLDELIRWESALKVLRPARS